MSWQLPGNSDALADGASTPCPTNDAARTARTRYFGAVSIAVDALLFIADSSLFEQTATTALIANGFFMDSSPLDSPCICRNVLQTSTCHTRSCPGTGSRRCLRGWSSRETRRGRSPNQSTEILSPQPPSRMIKTNHLEAGGWGGPQSTLAVEV